MERNQNQREAMPGRGYLIVSVRAGEGAIPIEGALVTLRGGEAIEGDRVLYHRSERQHAAHHAPRAAEG